VNNEEKKIAILKSHLQKLAQKF